MNSLASSSELKIMDIPNDCWSIIAEFMSCLREIKILRLISKSICLEMYNICGIPFKFETLKGKIALNHGKVEICNCIGKYFIFDGKYILFPKTTPDYWAFLEINKKFLPRMEQDFVPIIKIGNVCYDFPKCSQDGVFGDHMCGLGLNYAYKEYTKSMLICVNIDISNIDIVMKDIDDYYIDIPVYCLIYKLDKKIIEKISSIVFDKYGRADIREIAKKII